MSDVVVRYLACWNQTDPVARAALIAEVWATDARYVDPMADVTGRAAIDLTIGAVQQQFAGLEFSQVGAVDEHHDVVRFTWGLGPSGAEPIVIGFDVMQTAPDGRIQTVVGFLDRVPG
jgi:hypothetical protein